jgi:hypothetical protein
MEPNMDDAKPPYKPPADAQDINDLWLDPKLGDGLTDVHRYSIPVGKPKNFFRVVPFEAYRRPCEVYTHKIEGRIDEVTYVISKAMQGRTHEARRCTLVTCVYRDESLRLWPLKMPKDGERDNDAWSTARAAAKVALGRWVKLVWVGGAYKTVDAQKGYAPEPDYNKLPPFDELVRLAFGGHGIIDSMNHSIMRELLGAPANTDEEDGDEDFDGDAI